MCIIIVKPPACVLGRRELKEAFRINSDGAGLMFNVNGVIRVMKGWFGFRKYYKAFRSLEAQYPLSTFVLHMRIGTSGLRNRDNCHPFVVNNYVGFAHNGVIRSLGDKTRSDTREFVEETLQRLPDQWWTNQEILNAVEKCASHCGKFVLLYGDGQYSIMKPDAGHWKDGCWYSNYSYVLPTKTSNVTNVVGQRDKHWTVGGDTRNFKLSDEVRREYDGI